MILSKSVSRFARNIVDSLSFVRKLKAMGIAIYFEELADLAIQSKFNKDKYTEAIADCSQRIKDLRERRDMLVAHIRCNEKAREEIERIENYTKQMKPVMTEFDDAIIHRIVNSIHVTKDLNLRIFIKGGAEIIEPLFPDEEESA